MKIIGVGFQKTGTSSLDAALKELGYKVLGHRTDLAKDLFEGKIDKVLKITEDYDAMQDNPWALLYKELDKKYPGSKFILTIRNEEKWIKSVVNHFGTSNTEMRRWIYGVGHPEGNENLYLERYRAHNKEVKKYFENRQEDLLILEWEKGDGWEKLCSFLNKPVPNKEFPHTNKGIYSKKDKMIINIKAKIRNLIHT